MQRDQRKWAPVQQTAPAHTSLLASCLDASGTTLQRSSSTKCVTNAATKPHLRGCRSRMLPTPDRTQPAVQTYFFLENMVQRAALSPPPALLQLLRRGLLSPKAARQQAAPTRMRPHQQRLPTQRPQRRWAGQAATAEGVAVACGTRNDRLYTTKTVGHRRSTTVSGTVVDATRPTHRHAAPPNAATRGSPPRRPPTERQRAHPPRRPPLTCPSATHSRHRNPASPSLAHTAPPAQPCTRRHARHSGAGRAVPAANAAHVSVYTPVQARTGQPLPRDRRHEIIVVHNRLHTPARWEVDFNFLLAGKSTSER